MKKRKTQASAYAVIEIEWYCPECEREESERRAKEIKKRKEREEEERRRIERLRETHGRVCSSCGKKLYSEYCPECGSVAVPANWCFTCKKIVYSKYCPDCGDIIFQEKK
jgi:predicted RNA-binding Zn-ribbon protein involved in translation (DUF1610 family)